MKTQINIPNSNILTFIEACDKMHVIYHQIEARELDTRYEIIAEGYQLFHLGSLYGQELSLKNFHEVYGN
jgi:hypothetical protein